MTAAIILPVITLVLRPQAISPWSSINETVLAAKRFLDGELEKYKELKYADKNIRVLFDGKKGDFKKVKKQGVGRDTILKFLGGNWKQWMVQEALRVVAKKY